MGLGKTCTWFAKIHRRRIDHYRQRQLCSLTNPRRYDRDRQRRVLDRTRLSI